MARRKTAKYTTLYLQDGFDGTGAVDDSSLVATDTTMEIDTLVLADSRTLVTNGARFTTAGIATVREITATNNSQRWNLTNGGATAGTFELTLNGETAAALAYDITIAALQSALEGLASISAGDVVVSGTDGGPWVITMAGSTFGNVSTNTLTYDGSGLTGGPGVLSVVHDGTTTWEITFTPAIATGSVPSDDDVITFYPVRLEVSPDGQSVGDWSESEDPIIDLSRGFIDGSREGDDVPLEFNTVLVLSWFRASSGEPITPYEALNQLGNASTWLTSRGRATGGSYCEPYAVDVVMVDSPNCGSDEAEITIIRGFLKTSVDPSIENSVLTIAGTAVSTKAESFRTTNNADAIGIVN